jgi:hypothetical protein
LVGFGEVFRAALTSRLAVGDSGRKTMRGKASLGQPSMPIDLHSDNSRSDEMENTTLTDLKERLRAQGFEQKALVSDQEMELAIRAVEAEEGTLDTPAEELRYIEGLLNLPLRHLERFRILPAKGYGQCACGRTLSALDIVYTALTKRIHDKELMRDTLYGCPNMIEMSEDGRAAECFNCGRPVLSRGYWTKCYMYA